MESYFDSRWLHSAFDTIRFGAMSFHIGGTPLTAQTYKDMTAFEVSQVFQFPIDREYQPEGMSFVTMTEANELKPLAIGIAQVLNSTGEFLLSHGYQDLASFILDVTKPTNGTPPSAKHLVDQVRRNFTYRRWIKCILYICIYSNALPISIHSWSKHCLDFAISQLLMASVSDSFKSTADLKEHNIVAITC